MKAQNQFRVPSNQRFRSIVRLSMSLPVRDPWHDVFGGMLGRCCWARGRVPTTSRRRFNSGPPPVPELIWASVSVMPELR